MTNMRTQMEVYYTMNNDYRFACDDDPTLAAGFASVENMVDAEDVDDVWCLSSRTAWIFVSPLVWEDDNFYCLDSVGTAQVIDNYEEDSMTCLP